MPYCHFFWGMKTILAQSSGMLQTFLILHFQKADQYYLLKITRNREVRK